MLCLVGVGLFISRSPSRILLLSHFVQLQRDVSDDFLLILMIVSHEKKSVNETDLYEACHKVEIDGCQRLRMETTTTKQERTSSGTSSSKQSRGTSHDGQ
jgi:hypothetical protein